MGLGCIPDVPIEASQISNELPADPNPAGSIVAKHKAGGFLYPVLHRPTGARAFDRLELRGECHHRQLDSGRSAVEVLAG